MAVFVERAMNAGYFLIVGAKGGCGSTTLAVELAKSIRKRQKAAVIVDADLGGRRAIAELLAATPQLDAARTDCAFAVASAAGIEIVELVSKYEDVAALRSMELEGLASRIDELDGIAIVDVPRPFDHFVVAFVRRATRVLLVMQPDMLGSSSASMAIGELVRFGIPLERIWLVINDINKKQAIDAGALERILGVSVVAELPRDANRRAFDRVVDALASRMIEGASDVPFFRLPSLARLARPLANTMRRKSDLASVAGEMRGDELADDHAASDTRLHHRERRDRVRREINELMLARVDLVAASAGRSDGEKFAQLRDTIDHLIDGIVAERSDLGDFSLDDRAEIKREILDEQLGLGPLEDLMRDPAVSEIMVNGPSKIYVERGGKLTRSDRTFANARHLRLVIERIVAPLGRRIDESSPMVDARLTDGSRVNAIIEPLALNGATLTIRRFGSQRLTMERLLAFGSLPPQAIPLLRAIIEARLNVVVSGGTGSGKTTFLNILSNYIPGDERIVTIEDSAELALGQDNVVSLEARPPNIEGRGAVTIRELVRNALRMRPDRIVVGECRGGEAFDMLAAMNTGHDGSLTTLHANSARDSIARLETLVLMAGYDLPMSAIREQIASAVDIVIHVDRLRDGSRKITDIAECVGIRGGAVELKSILTFHARGLDERAAVVGAFVARGSAPQCSRRFAELGIAFDPRTLDELEREVAAPSNGASARSARARRRR